MTKPHYIMSGRPLGEAPKVLVMLHGRGSTAENILAIAPQLQLKNEFAIIAPQAPDHTWYPYSFLTPIHQNQPYLDQSLARIHLIMEDIYEAGIAHTSVFLLGFSQGACMALEYAARHAQPYGGVVAFTGGLIGDRIYDEFYQGDFEGAPIFIGSSDVDPHVPLHRVEESTVLLRKKGAKVIEKIYPGMGHTISAEELATVNELIFQKI